MNEFQANSEFRNAHPGSGPVGSDWPCLDAPRVATTDSTPVSSRLQERQKPARQLVPEWQISRLLGRWRILWRSFATNVAYVVRNLWCPVNDGTIQVRPRWAASRVGPSCLAGTALKSIA
jgi:hypothetical protein